jgi:outer membrane scaffolding protein for murein synthesis (MipA/OmpV family)
MDQEQSATNKNSGPGNTRTNLAPGVFGNYLVDGHYAILTAITSGGGIGKQHDGTLVSIGGRYIYQPDFDNRYYAIVSTTWANLHYMQDYYGVSQAQAAEYNMPEYETSAGMLKVKLAFGWNHVIDKKWSVLTGGSLTQPLGAASSSPLSSDKIQVVAYTAVYYKF